MRALEFEQRKSSNGAVFGVISAGEARRCWDCGAFCGLAGIDVVYMVSDPIYLAAEIISSLEPLISNF